MADEFMKGFGILSIAGLAWMILSGWFNTPGFETTQLIAPVPSGLDFYGQFSIILREVVFSRRTFILGNNSCNKRN